MRMCAVCNSLVGVGLQRCPVCGSRTSGQRQKVQKTAAVSDGVVTSEASETPVLNYKVCRICKKKMPPKAQRCRHCGSQVQTTNYATVLIVTLVGVLLLLLLMSAQF